MRCDGRFLQSSALPVMLLSAIACGAGSGGARDMMLMDTPAREDREVALVTDLGLNAVRFEGKFASDHLMDALDDAGVLVIPGWCCCDQWERSWMWLDEHWVVAEGSMLDQSRALRNHPSVLAFWYGSDSPPVPEAEALYMQILGADPATELAKATKEFLPIMERTEKT